MTQATETQGVLVDHERLKRWLVKAYEAAGFRANAAEVSADVVVRSEMRGVHTHGVRFVPMYVKMSKAGAIRVDASPHIIRERGATAVIDGDAAIGMHAGHMAAALALQKAQRADSGLAMVLVRNSNHWGASGYYAAMCAEAGLIGVAVSNSPPVMAASGARSSIIGNQPTAYAFPDPDGEGLIMLDIALSATAQTRVRIAAQLGVSIPEGWILDSEGRPSTDPKDIERGTLLPTGDYKGYGLAVLMETLTSVLSGAGILADCNYGAFRAGGTSHPSNTGHAVLALDIEAFMPRAEFATRLADLRQRIRDAPKAPGIDRVYVPGEIEHDHEADAIANGLELDSLSWGALAEVGQAVGLIDELDAVLAS
jgi:LDH2 family malate/lactate/ureidoglycolate dehydrogenase